MRRSAIPVGAVLCLSALLGEHVLSATPAPLVLKAARLFDGKSSTLQEPGVLLIQGQRITGVGRNVPLPADATVIDVGDATLLPGFIDAHTHTASVYHEERARGFYEDTMRFPAEQAFRAGRNALDELLAGVTTARVVGAPDFLDIALRNAIADGYAEGPRLLVAGHAIGSTGGHCDGPPIPPDKMPPRKPIEGICNGPDACREAVREQMKYGADLIKICASGGVMSEADPVDVPQLTSAELDAIVSEAHAWGRKVAAHAHGDRAARLAIEAGVDSIEHGSFLQPSTLRLMKRRGVYLVPTRMTVLWIIEKASTYPPRIRDKALAAGAAHATMMHNALNVGVLIAYGTDSTVYPHGINAQEFGDYVDLGMTAADALMTSSLGSARLLGIDAETGTLEIGKSADVVAVTGNVLQNIRATEAPILVMKQGRVVRRIPQ